MITRKTILVTGASGFVGSRLVKRLVTLNFNVHVFARSSSNLWRLKNELPKITLHNVDICDQSLVTATIAQIKPNSLFHLACYGGFANETNDEKIIATNTLATYYLLDACSKVKTEQFIYIGSSSEYGIKTKAITEEDLERPNNLYGITKLAGSNLTRLYAETGKLPGTILRIFSPYGINDDPRRLIPTVLAFIKRTCH
jgi:nucleoside-diphosphate-sugar epimerase